VIPIDFKGENQPKNIVKSHLIFKKLPNINKNLKHGYSTNCGHSLIPPLHTKGPYCTQFHFSAFMFQLYFILTPC
jgi:hypothetical protein